MTPRSPVWNQPPRYVAAVSLGPPPVPRSQPAARHSVLSSAAIDLQLLPAKLPEEPFAQARRARAPGREEDLHAGDVVAARFVGVQELDGGGGDHDRSEEHTA